MTTEIPKDEMPDDIRKKACEVMRKSGEQYGLPAVGHLRTIAAALLTERREAEARVREHIAKELDDCAKHAEAHAIDAANHGAMAAAYKKTDASDLFKALAAAIREGR